MSERASTAYLNYLNERRADITRVVTDECAARIALYGALPPTAATQTIDATLGIMFEALARRDSRPLLEWVKQRLVVRINQGLALPEALRLPGIFRRHLVEFSLPAIAGQIEGAAEGMLFVSAMCDEAAELMGQFYSRRLEEMQELALRELSTPLLTVSDHAVVMPLIGTIDSRRAQQVIETLLEGITSSGAGIAILDITGVPLVDTQVADALLRAAQAVRLLGAQVVLTGIRPEVAQTLVGLGADLREIVSRSTLQSGIAYAMAQRSWDGTARK